LEKVETIGPSSVRIPIDGKPKSQVLAEAGISTSTALRYAGVDEFAKKIGFKKVAAHPKPDDPPRVAAER
jgi:hypothetical protein